MVNRVGRHVSYISQHVPDLPENYDGDEMKKKGKGCSIWLTDFFFFFAALMIYRFVRSFTVSPPQTFRVALDKYSPWLLKLYHAKKRAFSQDMENLLQRLNKHVFLVFIFGIRFPENVGILEFGLYFSHLSGGIYWQI